MYKRRFNHSTTWRQGRPERRLGLWTCWIIIRRTQWTASSVEKVRCAPYGFSLDSAGYWTAGTYILRSLRRVFSARLNLCLAFSSHCIISLLQGLLPTQKKKTIRSVEIKDIQTTKYFHRQDMPSLRSGRKADMLKKKIQPWLEKQLKYKFNH
jgi:hypothetical protein